MFYHGSPGNHRGRVGRSQRSAGGSLQVSPPEFPRVRAAVGSVRPREGLARPTASAPREGALRPRSRPREVGYRLGCTPECLVGTFAKGQPSTDSHIARPPGERALRSSTAGGSGTDRGETPSQGRLHRPDRYRLPALASHSRPQAHAIPPRESRHQTPPEGVNGAVSIREGGGRVAAGRRGPAATKPRVNR